MTIALVHNFIMQGNNTQGTKDIWSTMMQAYQDALLRLVGTIYRGSPDTRLRRLGLDQSRT